MPKFVTAYAVTHHYGGPEEGGWWYNWYEPVETVAAEPEKAETVREELRTKHADQEWGDIYSMEGGVALV